VQCPSSIADTVQPAALNDLSLAALDAEMTVAATTPTALEFAFVSSTRQVYLEYILIRKHSTLQVAGDFIRVYRSGVITKQLHFWEEINLGNHKI